MSDPVLGNQSGPASAARGSADWRADLAAYDQLPPDLKAAIQDAALEVDAAGVLQHYAALRLTGRSEAFAVAATAGELTRFMRRILARSTSKPG